MTLSTLIAAVGSFLGPADLYGWTGERREVGWCEVEPVKLPDGKWSLKLTYVVEDSTVVSWLNAYKWPMPQKDLSRFEEVEFELKALEPGPLHIRLDDPDVPRKN